MMENQDSSPSLDDILADDAAAAPVAEAQDATVESGKRLSAARQYAMNQYEKIRQATEGQLLGVRRYTETAREQINEQWDETCVKAKELHQAGEEYVKTKPTQCVLGALGLGIIIGLLFGRKD